MKIKLDENMPASAVRLLAGQGHDVATVTEQGLGGALDTDVFRAVVGERRMLMTLDRGFGDVRSYPPGKHAGIIVLRVRQQNSASVNEALRALVAAHDLETFDECVVVAQRHLVRVRRPAGE